jgi:hypothetical protein
MNGRQLAEAVTKISPRVRVLYMSGYTSSAIPHYGVLALGLWFLPKPFSLSAPGAPFLAFFARSGAFRRHLPSPAKVREVLDASPDAPQGELPDKP